MEPITLGYLGMAIMFTLAAVLWHYYRGQRRSRCDEEEPECLR